MVANNKATYKKITILKNELGDLQEKCKQILKDNISRLIMVKDKYEDAKKKYKDTNKKNEDLAKELEKQKTNCILLLTDKDNIIRQLNTVTNKLEEKHKLLDQKKKIIDTLKRDYEIAMVGKASAKSELAQMVKNKHREDKFLTNLNKKYREVNKNNEDLVKDTDNITLHTKKLKMDKEADKHRRAQEDDDDKEGDEVLSSQGGEDHIPLSNYVTQHSTDGDVTSMSLTQEPFPDTHNLNDTTDNYNQSWDSLTHRDPIPSSPAPQQDNLAMNEPNLLAESPTNTRACGVITSDDDDSVKGAYPTSPQFDITKAQNLLPPTQFCPNRVQNLDHLLPIKSTPKQRSPTNQRRYKANTKRKKTWRSMKGGISKHDSYRNHRQDDDEDDCNAQNCRPHHL